MQYTELKIHQLINDGISTAFYVDYNIDLADNEPIPITKSIDDVEDISSRKADYSKTITIPGTDNNNKIFSSIFNLARSLYRYDPKDINGNNLTILQNFNPDFDPTLKAESTIYRNGVVVMKGYLQLTDIRITDENRIEYDVIIIGKVGNLFQDIGEGKLNEIDLSAYNHEWNRSNITGSWTAPIGVGYLYGMIDLGLVSDQQNFYVEHWLPQIYLKTIVDAIFAKYGYSYASDFFTSDRFKRLVIPFAGKEFIKTNAHLTDLSCIAGRSTDSGWTSITGYRATTTFYMDTVTKQSVPPPPFGGYDTTLYKFIIPETGAYAFDTTFIFDIKNTTSGAAIPSYYVDLQMMKNGSPIDMCSIGYITLPASSGTYNINTGKQFGQKSFIIGDEVTFILRPNYGTTETSIKFLTGSSLTVVPDYKINEGSTITLSDCLPSDILQRDLLSSIFKMFNLYIQPDEDNPKKLIIEPYDTFFNGAVVDLTDYVDYNSEVKIMPMGALKYKSYNYSYKPDKDQTNNKHQSQFIDTYGIRKFKIVNDFVNDEYKTEVIFAPTPLVDWIDKTRNNRVQSQISFLDTSNNHVASASVIRLLYYGGKVGCTWFTINSKITGLYSTGYVSFPYVGHLDSVTNPTFDLSFGVPTQVQYKSTIYTLGNLFNTYHRQNLLELIDPDSKIVEFKMRLNEIQQSKLDFRKNYFIDKQYYRLYKVDFDASSDDLTTVQFLKLRTKSAFINGQTGMNGGSGDFLPTGDEITGQSLPSYSPVILSNGNSFQPGIDVIPFGSNNNLQGTSIIVNSNNNTIQGDLISVLGGSGNTAVLGSETLLNCNDFTSVIANETAANNIQLPFLATRLLTSSELQNLSTTPIQIVPKIDGFWTEVLRAYIDISFGDLTPVAYTRRKLSLEFTGDGTHIVEFDNSITKAITATMQRGIQYSDTVFKDAAINLTAPATLGASGNGVMLVSVHYCLHKIIK